YVLPAPSCLKERAMMFRQQKLIYLPMVGTILLGLLVGVYLAAWKRFSKSDPPASIMKHSVETPSDDVLNYWTADKMRNARPARLPHVSALKRRKKQPQHPSDASSSPNA